MLYLLIIAIAAIVAYSIFITDVNDNSNGESEGEKLDPKKMMMKENKVKNIQDDDWGKSVFEIDDKYKFAYLEFQKLETNLLFDTDVPADDFPGPLVIFGLTEEMKNKYINKKEISKEEILEIYHTLRDMLTYIKLPEVKAGETCFTNKTEEGLRFVVVAKNPHNDDEVMMVILLLSNIAL